MMPNAFTTSQFQGPLYELLNREEDFLLSNSSTNPFFDREAREEEVFHNSYENQLLSGYRNGFYHGENSWLISQMNKYMPEKETEDAVQKLLNISWLANESLSEAEWTYNTAFRPSCGSETSSTVSITDLILGKKRRDRDHFLFRLQEQAMDDRYKKLLLMNRVSQGFNSECAIEKKCKRKS